jgi:hypothetical protein
MTNPKLNSVINLKIAQKKLRRSESYYAGGTSPELDYFPFDRIYLFKQNLLPTMKKVFRYSLYMALSAPLYKALSQVYVDEYRDLPLIRNDSRSEYKRVRALNAFKTQIKDPKDWILMVPTHVRSKYRDPSKRIKPYASEVAYILSSAISLKHNKGMFLPEITLHTPREDIPAMCSLCKNQAAYLANECNPGQYSCQKEHEILLELDNYHANAAKQSLKASGGTE